MTSKHNLKLNYNVNISENWKIVEKADGKKQFLINGTAINATTTSNGHKFTTEELKPSAKSLSNRPLLKDHINSVDSIVGKTIKASFDETLNCVVFEAFVSDSEMQNKIINGLIDSVSVGAEVEEAVYNEQEEVYELKGITFRELSLVAVPADEHANFAMAIMCAMDLNSNKSIKLQTDTKIEKIEKVEKNIIEKSTEENVEDNKANNIIVNKKMSEDKMEKEEFEKSIQEKDSAISELNTKLATQEKMLQEIEESKLTELKESYTTIAKEKGVEPIDVSEATKDLMSALISQIKAIEKVTEVKKETTKGIVKSKNVSQENGDNYFITREDTVNGVAIFKSPISEDSNSVFFRG